MDALKLLAALSTSGSGSKNKEPRERHHTYIDINDILTLAKNTPQVDRGTAVEINVGLDTTLTRVVFTRNDVISIYGTEQPDKTFIAYRTNVWTPRTHMRSNDVQDGYDDLQRGQGIGCIYLPAMSVYCKLQYTNDGKVKRNFVTHVTNEEVQVLLDNDLGLVILLSVSFQLFHWKFMLFFVA